MNKNCAGAEGGDGNGEVTAVVPWPAWPKAVGAENV